MTSAALSESLIERQIECEVRRDAAYFEAMRRDDEAKVLLARAACYEREANALRRAQGLLRNG